MQNKNIINIKMIAMQENKSLLKHKVKDKQFYLEKSRIKIM